MAETEVALTPELAVSPTLDISLRVRLSIMMFLQYAVWGAWYSVLSKYLIELKFTGPQIGDIYGTVAIASIFAPLLFGQLADRWVPTQFLLAGLHLAGAVVLYFMTQLTGFSGLYTAALVYCLLYVPTISLTNSLSMHQIPNAAKDFPGIRVFGTIGWIVIGLFVGWQLNDKSPQPIMAAGILSLVLGVYCLTLPNTPPKGKAGETLPFLRAVGLLKDRTFLVFIVVSFIIAVVLAGYYTWTGPFLENAGERLGAESLKKAAAIMTIGQFTEMIFLPFLPFLLSRFGMKLTLAVGMAAWAVRYGIFAMGGPVELILMGIALHGICYDFFFVAACIHVDNKAGKEIRASAQALYNLVVMGLGFYLGNKIFGQLVQFFTTEDKGIHWAGVWASPLIGAVLAMSIFMIGFHEKKPVTEEI